MTKEKKTFQPLSSNNVYEIYESLLKRNLVSFSLTEEGRHKIDSLVSTINSIYFGKEIYETNEQKAVAYLYFIIKDHPFVDGNKRTATLAFEVLCNINNLEPGYSFHELESIPVTIEKNKEKDYHDVIKRLSKLIFANKTGESSGNVPGKLKTEIERKWLLSRLPDVSEIMPIEYERYFLPSKKGEEIRIQKKNSKYSYERKVEIPGVGRERAEDKEISEEKFLELKATASKAVVRTRYDLSTNVAIQVYHGDYDGLIRYEVEFPNVETSQNFKKEDWMGKEITSSPLGRDSQLLKLDRENFLAELKKFS